MLLEPIPGLTREERMDELEGESFAAFASTMGR